MREAEVLGKYLVVEGFKNVAVKDVDDLFNLIGSGSKTSHVQVLDAELVAGFEHVYFAVLNALKAFKSGINISKNLSIEILLFASGQDQIRRAIEILGVKRTTKKIVVVIVSDSREEALSTLNAISNIINGEADYSVIELNEEKISAIINAFGISRCELESSMRNSLENALKNVLVERAALSITRR
ncbi:MAG: KEOPS complex subunit Cgi121 [Candidatus Bathyarchaeota archaeon]|nr:KEOPS complex subunit Cgi121 [Candidatus Bathyarchaeota archaeon]